MNFITYPFRLLVFIPLVIILSFCIMFKSYSMLRKLSTWGLKLRIREDIMYCNLAYVNIMYDKDIDSGLINSEKALEINPKLFQAATNIMYVYIAKENHAKVIEVYENFPKKNIAYLKNNAAVSYIRLKDYDKAMELILEGIKKGRFLHFLFYNKSYIEAKRGQVDEALKSVKKAIRLGGLDNYHKHCSYVYALKGDFKKALKEIKIYLKKSKEAFLFEENVPEWQAIFSQNIEDKNFNELKKIVEGLPSKNWTESVLSK